MAGAVTAACCQGRGAATSSLGPLFSLAFLADLPTCATVTKHPRLGGLQRKGNQSSPLQSEARASKGIR